MEANPSPSLDTRGCLIRLTWTVLAPGAMLVTAAVIAQFRLALVSVADAVFVAAVVAALAARRLEPAIPPGAPPNPDGSIDVGRTNPRTYVIGLLVLAAVTYALARYGAARGA